MSEKQQLARQGLLAALQLRQSKEILPGDSLCVYDLAEACDAHVRFDDVNSMEGTYARAKKTIMVSAHRPFGRKAFTCAHELAHHQFGHGFHVDQLIEFADRPFTPADFLADCFAGFLLMPKLAVDRGFAARGWSSSDCSPEQAFIVSGWLGVGYETLVKHLHYSLRILPKERMTLLLKTSPKSLRAGIVGTDIAEDVFVVDTQWTGRAVDLQVGDCIIAPQGSEVEDIYLQSSGKAARGGILRAVCPGLGRLTIPGSGWATHVRVAKRDFVGWNTYRHLEEPTEE